MKRVHACTFALFIVAALSANAQPPSDGLLFHASFDQGTTADHSAAGTPKPTYEAHVKPITNGARAGALECGDYQLLAYRAPGNVYAQRGTVSFFWRSRYPVGPTAFPIFRVGYADHSSWDMVFLRIDYNGAGFDAFVTDASLARTRVSAKIDPFPAATHWTHVAFAWDEREGVRLYLDGRLAAIRTAKARYDAALDQFGPHSRVISPYQVQSDYNFVRGGDIDELRTYDRMLDDAAIAALASAHSGAGGVPPPHGMSPPPSPSNARTLSDPATRAAWYHRYGWDHAAPPALPAGRSVTIRKVEIHEAYDLKRWWWKATDGIRETTWPGVYNRSRLPGRHDYFELPDWDCYVESGRALSFALPEERWNHIEIAGSAWGAMELLPSATELANAAAAKAESVLFVRDRNREKTVHRLGSALKGRSLRFTNREAEEPIGELAAYHVAPGAEPHDTGAVALRLVPQAQRTGLDELAGIERYIDGRFPANQRSRAVAQPASQPLPLLDYARRPGLPIVHVLMPAPAPQQAEALDGLVLELPALEAKPTHDGLICLNVQLKDPLWPLRNLVDFTFSLAPGEAKTLWFDTRDRILPPGKPLWMTIASSSADFDETVLHGAEVRLVPKPREAARAEHEIDRFTQVRDLYAMIIEERPSDPRLDLWNRFKGDLDDLLRANPEHKLGREYQAAGVRGAPRPAFEQPTPPPNVPLWAFRQSVLLKQVHDFVTWYIDHRQVPYGDFGGGISDDTDLLNTWPGVALMGCSPDRIERSVAALLDAAYHNGMFANGLPAIQTDELHSYEEGINSIGQILLLRYGSPRQIERALETARGIEGITGINAAGHRHLRTSYFSGTRMATEDPWGVAKPYSYLVLQVPQLLVEFNGHRPTRSYLVELADGLLAHHRTGGATLRAGVPAIRFADDSEHDLGRGAFPWHVFWGAYQFTGAEKYLQPILDGGITSLAFVNPNVLDLLGVRAEWGRRFEGGERAATIGGRRDGSSARARTTDLRSANRGHFAWQLTGDKTQLEELYAAQIQYCAQSEFINTHGSLWTDRVGVPTVELQRARLGGVALVRNGVYPGHAVSWRFAAPAKAESVAILIPNATRTEMKVIAFNLESVPVTATMTGWNIDPGTWEITQGTDTDGDDTPDDATTLRQLPFERSRSIEVTLPPQRTTVLSLKRIAAGRPYWERPELGIDPDDVRLSGHTVRVRVHGLGSVPSPATSVAVLDRDGRVIVTAPLPKIDALTDYVPRTVDLELTLPAGTALDGARVVIDPEGRLDEITRMNNAAGLQ